MTAISFPKAKDPRNGASPVLILGARSDIARALAHILASRGHPLQLAARNASTLQMDADDFTLRHGVSVTVHEFDVLQPETFKPFLSNLPATPHVVISAVGLMGDQEANAASTSLASQIIATNFTGPALFLEEAARHLVAEEGPTALIGISSVAGDRGRARNYIYGAAKAGFTAYLSGLRQKYVRSNLLVMTVRPGFVATAMTSDMDLPARLTISPEQLAVRIIKSLDRRRPVHVDLLWRLIMGIIVHLPERVFMRLKF